MEIGRTGTGMETIYTVIAEPPIEAPSAALLATIVETKIDVRVVFEDGNPFGALETKDQPRDNQGSTKDQPRDNQGSTNDQADIQQLQSGSKQVAPEPAPNLDMPDNNVGNVALDAISSLKRAADKTAAKPVTTDDIPY